MNYNVKAEQYKMYVGEIPIKISRLSLKSGTPMYNTKFRDLTCPGTVEKIANSLDASANVSFFHGYYQCKLICATS